MNDKTTTDPLRQYLFVHASAGCEVLGVWEVSGDLEAARLRMQLSKMYPDCRTESEVATSFDQVKAGLPRFDFGSLEPEVISSVSRR